MAFAPTRDFYFRIQKPDDGYSSTLSSSTMWYSTRIVLYCSKYSAVQYSTVSENAFPRVHSKRLVFY